MTSYVAKNDSMCLYDFFFFSFFVSQMPSTFLKSLYVSPLSLSLSWGRGRTNEVDDDKG